jgi:Tfp pilus assembly protein PilN
MIEINLLPGAKHKRGGKGVALTLPDVAALIGQIKDPWLVGAIAAWVLVLALGLPLYLKRQAQVSDLGPKLEAAQRDSVRYSGILIRKAQLERRRDSLLAEIEVIRDIDRDRYIWPHVLDAVTKALPPYLWLDDLAAHAGESDSTGGGASFTIQGKTADPQALTRFMRNLEESPFVEGVQIVSSALVTEQGHDVTSFNLTARYEIPPISILTMEPLAASVVQGVRSGGGARH